MDYQDVFPAILAYEDDGLSPSEELELFSKLIETRVAFSLQGSYGRRAVWFMEQGYILPNGEITGAGLAVFGEGEEPGLVVRYGRYEASPPNLDFGGSH